MPTSVQKASKKQGSELFSVIKGRRQDAHLHGPILDNPEAEEIIMSDYPAKLKKLGFSDKDIARIMGYRDNPPDGSAGGGPQGFARGGPGSAPWNVRRAAHPKHPPGMIQSSIPGRTDKIPMSVPSGSYIIPADIPSALGQGNTMAGEKILGAMFKSGPYSPESVQSISGKLPKAKAGPAPRKPIIMQRPRVGKMPRERGFAEGGEAPDVPIIAAGGEYVIHPEQVRQVGGGDLTAGHRTLDKLVLGIRKKNIDTLKKLKPPKK